MTKKQILLTNDDGINSPGLWKVAEALSEIGYVTVAAPREQSSGAGHSLPLSSDGKIQPQIMRINDQDWTVYAIGGTPGQAVLHAILEIMPEKPDLVVSGINYGENLGDGITISGTVGAVLEAATHNIPGIAVSLETRAEYHHSYSQDINFSTAAYFTQFFARMMLENKMPYDVDAFKLDVPADATPETAWRVTRIGRHRYYLPEVYRKGTWAEKGAIHVHQQVSPDEVEPDTDIYTVIFDKMVSLTPLSLDMTSRVDLGNFEQKLRGLA